MKLLKGKDVLVGVIDVASDEVETPQEVAATIRTALKYVPAQHLFPCTNCGMAPMRRDIALAKLKALGAGAALARKRLGKGVLTVGWGSGRPARKARAAKKKK
jgi:5-methyltetrahydropteroyltriglutamate--homocysteine methyltransferase